MYIYIPVDMRAWLLAGCLLEELERYNIGDLINVRSDLPSQIYVDIRSPTKYLYTYLSISICGHPSHAKVLPVCWVVQCTCTL